MAHNRAVPGSFGEVYELARACVCLRSARPALQDDDLAQGCCNMRLVVIMLGGAAGALLRYGVSTWALRWFGHGFADGTLLVNLAGCLLIGLAFGIGEQRGLNPLFRLMFITGFLGALTTFSTYGLETVNHAALGLTRVALINIIVQNVCGLLLVRCGIWLAQRLG